MLTAKLLNEIRRRLMSLCMRQLKITSKHARKLGKDKDVLAMHNELLDVYNALKGK